VCVSERRASEDKIKGWIKEDFKTIKIVETIFVL